MSLPRSPIEQKELKQPRKRQPKFSSRTSPFVGLSLEEPTPPEMAKLLKALNEKEQDLELAAKLGNSLLQENKELQEKNEFLEESLATNNETIAQLQKQLKQRNKLFHTIVDLESEHDEEEKQNGSIERPEDLSRVERQIKQLEGENKELRVKTRQMEGLKAIVERREQQRIGEYIGRLRGANLKIAQLQIQLGEKSQQCQAHAEEVQRLLKEIAQRKSREKILWGENEDIQTRLEDALTSHGELRAEMEQLQERHFELISMLRETEDELRMHRERAAQAPPPPKRTSSTDSLYDSLASELEGADSGCYNTPMFSARYGPSPHWSSFSTGGDQPGCSSAPDQIFTQQEIEPIEECTTTTFTAESASNNNVAVEDKRSALLEERESFDVPSRALLEVVRSTFNDRRILRRISPSSKHLPLRKEAATINWACSELSKSNEDVNKDELTTPTANTTKVDEMAEKYYKDACCSPIEFPSSNSSTPRRPDCNASKKSCGLAKEEVTIGIDQHIMDEPPEEKPRRIIASPELPPEDPEQAENVQKPLCSHDNEVDSEPPPTSTASSPSSESLDSLEDYNPPKMGAPGRPGTKDLDFSIKRLNLRKEINERYLKFRASKGLLPAQFYTSQEPVYQSTFGSLGPTKQLNQLSQQRYATSSQSNPHCSRFSFRPIVLNQQSPGLSSVLRNIPSSSSLAMPVGICRIADFSDSIKANQYAISQLGGMSKSGSYSSGLDFAFDGLSTKRALLTVKQLSRPNSFASQVLQRQAKTVTAEYRENQHLPSLFTFQMPMKRAGINKMESPTKWHLNIAGCPASISNSTSELGLGSLLSPSTEPAALYETSASSAGILQRYSQNQRH